MAIVGLVRTLPTVRPCASVVLVSLGLVILPVLAILIVPETAASDYAVAKAGQVIRQHLGPRDFRSREITVHARILALPIDGRLGYAVLVDDRLVYRRSRNDSSPHPAFITFTMKDDALQAARRDGVTLQIQIEDAGPDTFAVYPVVPSLLGASSTIDASPVLVSGFGGFTSGGIPVWTHPGTDSPVRP